MLKSFRHNIINFADFYKLLVLNFLKLFYVFNAENFSLMDKLSLIKIINYFYLFIYFFLKVSTTISIPSLIKNWML